MIIDAHAHALNEAYPFDIGDPEGKRALPALNRLGEEARRKIFRDNAAVVLATARASGKTHAG